MMCMVFQGNEALVYGFDTFRPRPPGGAQATFAFLSLSL